jgi:hypothetical protein
LIARARPSYVASFALLEDWGASRKFWDEVYKIFLFITIIPYDCFTK